MADLRLTENQVSGILRERDQREFGTLNLTFQPPNTLAGALTEAGTAYPITLTRSEWVPPPRE